MNRYHESMEHCAPPPELEEQLREAVLSAEPEPQARTAVYRPRGFFRKALLAAVLAVILNLVLPKESQGEKPVTATTAAEGAGKVQVYDELVEP